jgi:hypothetical protein
MASPGPDSLDPDTPEADMTNDTDGTDSLGGITL